ncbi:type I-C CRISPR-associated protein Cas8c/Csd1 [Phreatobacter sp. AB_2022a]|uniref:type I-C CRISPR-associated protein Cas8c/Csd1 n=1 Tax=Phreatobacter sp. AB_2022a TaxID=3003134 RepID=UPI002286DC4C|nr:type I-C CRISPR-associated protein Cas8c/Csd1 [Phreatobacter sp. AB_2022a]MCZ0735973.1 type I-C CRISPR-associated protein Cas8c/Csd1 [Phreatobacter sp. AB_2022a]
MTILASLVRAHGRLTSRGEVPTFGFSQQGIGWLIALDTDGKPVGSPHDLARVQGKKRLPQQMAVPSPVKRTSGIAPNFLWDKTAYVLGVTAGTGARTAQEHQAFLDRHREWIAGTNDEGLVAFLRFLDWWRPEKFVELGWSEEMKDQNLVFALESERMANVRLHDRPAAKALWARLQSDGGRPEAVCLVTGERAPIARLHPAIKGVWGAQTAGASIVSFNLDAFTSYGKEQGDNAPVSDVAAAAYTSALNHFLERGSRHRLQIGDASTVFWAEAADSAAADAADAMFQQFFAIDENMEADKVGALLDNLRHGRPVGDLQPALSSGVRFFVLGLAPNAARLSVRFFVENDFGVIAKRYLDHLERLRIDPPPREENPSIWRMLIETAVLRKSDNIQPNLAGDWFRAILTDTPYPMTLLSSLIMRLRADHDVNALRAAILKSVLIKNFNVEAPVSLDPACRDKGYLWGRLFAVFEQVQVAALGTGVNATIKDKFYGAASAQPRKVFRIIQSGSAYHLSKIGKQNPGRRINLEKLIAEIMEEMTPSDDPFPASLPDKSQALFALGYYHQRNAFFRKTDKTGPGEAA